MSEGTERPSKWVPPTNLVDLAHLGKHLEELGECVAMLGRIVCQGIEGIDPDTTEPNRVALEKEIADVAAMAKLTADRFGLDKESMNARALRKVAMKQAWHAMIEGRCAILYSVNSGPVSFVSTDDSENVCEFPSRAAAEHYAEGNMLFLSGQAQYWIVELQ